MYKTLSIYDLPAGMDGDAFWKYHTEVHASDVKKAAGSMLVHFKLSRVKEVLEGEVKAFGIIEMWWKDKESSEKYNDVQKSFKTASGKPPMEDFISRGPVLRAHLHVEEKRIF